MQNLKTKVSDKLSVLPMTELEYMKENHFYMQDFAFEQPEVLALEALCDDSKDLAKQLADETKEIYENIEEQKSENEKLQTEYDSKAAELQSLLQQYEAKKEQISKQNLVKMVNQHSASLNKEANAIHKQYKKQEISISDFITQYRNKKMEYHNFNYCGNALREQQF